MIAFGYETSGEDASRQIGFKKQNPKKAKPKLIVDSSEAHLLTIAPTGAGKGTSQVIPTCLTYPGSLLVVDVKGECAAVSAKARKKFGPVYIIDPFKIVTKTPDRFNPFDIGKEQPNEQKGVMIAKSLQVEGASVPSDPFWDCKANELISALCIREMEHTRSFVNLRKVMFSGDVDYDIARMLDNKEVTSLFAKELLEAYLHIPDDKTRPCVLCTAQQHLAILGDPAVLETLSGPTSFNDDDLLAGKPMTIYFIIPPGKIAAYAALLRLWINSILNLFGERMHKPEKPTLFIIDEAGNLGKMPALTTAITLMRSYGLRVWPIYQDLWQLKQLYPNEWVTIINNCDVISVFGLRTYMMAKEIADILGNITPASLFNMPKENGILHRTGMTLKQVRRVNYLTDALFKGTGFETNPLYGKPKSI